MQAAISACFLSLFSAVLADCPPGYTQFRDSCYAYMQGKQQWAAAQQICTTLGGHLPEIYNQEEMDFLVNMTREHGTEDTWLGGDDLIQEGLWTWAWSGSAMEYTSWGPGQPDNGHEEHCMELNDRDSLWNDEQCNHEKHYICQRSAELEVIEPEVGK